MDLGHYYSFKREFSQADALNEKALNIAEAFDVTKETDADRILTIRKVESFATITLARLHLIRGELIRRRC